MHSTLSREPVNGFIILTWIHHWNRGIRGLYFGDLDLIFKAQETLEYQIWTKNGLFALCLVKQSMDAY